MTIALTCYTVCVDDSDDDYGRDDDMCSPCKEAVMCNGGPVLAGSMTSCQKRPNTFSKPAGHIAYSFVRSGVG